MTIGDGMIKISHRGNIFGRNPERENNPEYIDEAINLGFNVEVDVKWSECKFYLGHDTHQYKVFTSWLFDRKSKLWVHIKDIRAAPVLVDCGLRCFFHENERHTLISNSNLIWTHDLSDVTPCSIIPLLSKVDMNLLPKYLHVKGICTDYPGLL